MSSSTASVRNVPRSEISLARPASLVWRLFAQPVLHLAVLLGCMLWLFLESVEVQRAMAGVPSFAMDDSWIHVAVARNFATGQGWGVVPGETLSVSTSPTWTLLLAVFFLFFVNPIKIAFLCSVGSMAVACVLCYFLALKLSGRKAIAFFTTFVLITNPISIWGVASGLELPLALAGLMAALLAFYSADAASFTRRVIAPVACAFAAITRPELFVLLPLMTLETARVLWRDQRNFSLIVRVVGTQVIAGTLALLPYFAFNLYSHGKIFPATYYAKTIVRGVGLSAALKDGSAAALKQSLLLDPLRQCSQIIDSLQTQNMALLLLITPGLLFFAKPFASAVARRGLLLPLSFFVIAWIMGMGSPSRYMSNHADRYFVIFPPLAALLCGLGLTVMLQSARLRALPCIAAALVMLAPLRTTENVLRHIGIDAESTQRLYVEMPTWIHENLDPNARLAVNDIGGIAYHAPRPLIDVMGLASPQIWPAIQRDYGKPVPVKRLREYLREQKIEYVILGSRYYPELTRDRETFEPIKEWRESYEHGRTISPQVLYKVHWKE